MYLEALEAHNEAHAAPGADKLDGHKAERLARFNKAHGLH